MLEDCLVKLLPVDSRLENWLVENWLEKWLVEYRHEKWPEEDCLVENWL